MIRFVELEQLLAYVPVRERQIADRADRVGVRARLEPALDDRRMKRREAVEIAKERPDALDRRVDDTAGEGGVVHRRSVPRAKRARRARAS
ncbi:hypothetical protein DM56_4699 [Burkholderia mallei]|nr:hypothetical protein DM56_4699 [Burkholderia mallei]